MQNILRSWLVPGYLLAVLLLGGASAAGLAANALLQLVGAGLIAWILWSGDQASATRTGLKPFLIALAAIGLLQFLPLPALIWRYFPGREAVAYGFELAGMPVPWLPFSLDPWGSLQSLIWWIPAFALFASAKMEGRLTSRHVVTVVGIVAYGSVALAIVQAFGGSGYLYAITNRSNGVGLFANSNHFGSFMLIGLVLIAGQWLQDRPATYRLRPAMAKGRILVARLAPLVFGVFLSNSLACALLLLPVVAGICLLYWPRTKVNWLVVLLALPVVAVGLVWLLGLGLVSNDLMAKSGTAGISRGEFLVNGVAMAKAFAPLGAGLGTFREIYPWFEQPDLVGTTYVNHAHNDLLELLIETGLFGVIVLGVFMRWFVSKLREIWGSARESNPVAVAAAIAVGAVLIHSLADYPLRTGALSSLVAVCLVLMCRSPDAQSGSANPRQSPRRAPVSI